MKRRSVSTIRSSTTTARTTSWSTSSTRCRQVATGALGALANDWQLSGIYRWTSGRPYAVNFSIPGIGAENLTGTDGNPNARVVVTCDPGRGWSGDAYGSSIRRASRRRSPAAMARNRRASSSCSTDQQPRPVDLEELQRAERHEVRVAPRHVQRAQPHAVHRRQQQRELRQPDRSDGHQPALRCRAATSCGKTVSARSTAWRHHARCNW